MIAQFASRVSRVIGVRSFLCDFPATGVEPPTPRRVISASPAGGAERRTSGRLLLGESGARAGRGPREMLARALGN